MNPSELKAVLHDRGAVTEGHFKLSSGRHSDLYVQKFRVFEHPRLTQRFGEAIAELFDGGFDVVASPAVGALTLGFAVALAGDARMIFAERQEGHMRFRRGFALAARERVLVVEDVVTTGGSAREVLDLVGQGPAEAIGLAALIDRTPSALTDLGVPFRALLRIDATSWEESECPLCARDVPLEEPGSSRLR